MSTPQRLWCHIVLDVFVFYCCWHCCAVGCEDFAVVVVVVVEMVDQNC